MSAAATVAAIALCWLVGTVTRGEPLPLLDKPIPIVLAGHVVLVMLYAVLGVALGQLTRSIPAAIVIVLVTPLVIEPVITALPELDVLSWLRDVVPYLPFTAGMQLVTAGLSAADQAGSLARAVGRRCGVRRIHRGVARHRLASVRASRRLTPGSALSHTLLLARTPLAEGVRADKAVCESARTHPADLG